MSPKKQIENFNKVLKEILDEEIRLGNRIFEVSEGWPKETTIMIVLEKEFLSPVARNLEGIEYRELNDPHYWKAEYYDKYTGHILACKFN